GSGPAPGFSTTTPTSRRWRATAPQRSSDRRAYGRGLSCSQRQPMERQSCVRYVAWRGRQSMSSIPSAVRTTKARTNAIWPSTVSMSRRAFPIPYSPCVSNGTRLRRASSRETLPRDRGAFGVRPRSAPDALACVGSGVCVLDEGFGRAAVHGIRGNAPGARRHLDSTTARELHVGPIEDLHQTDDHLLGFLARRVR